MKIEMNDAVISEILQKWVPGLADFGIQIVSAILILVIGLRVAAVFERMLKRSFEKLDMEISLRKFLLSLIHACVWAVLLFMAADTIGISSASIIAVLGSAGLALGLSLQGCLANFAGGVLILMVKPFRVGDYIVCSGGEGRVAAIGLVYTTLHTVDNQRVVIPNGSLANSPITNVTAKEKRRVDLEIGVSYHSDLRLAKECMRRVYEGHPQIDKAEEVLVFVSELGDDAVKIGGRGWTATDDYWKVRWELTEELKLACDAEGIEIPYRQMDVHVDTPSMGGFGG